ncbi:hypothetical protein GCM10023149_50170 [Mucilaginibacter gynuensis]|uniref:Pentapeptide MXKDX repeat protein n=1 Tax=Mucilaginibacter gynuensis TaxID=1302236 RepID=A0ABP8HI41_9SPHI
MKKIILSTALILSTVTASLANTATINRDKKDISQADYRDKKDISQADAKRDKKDISQADAKRDKKDISQAD